MAATDHDTDRSPQIGETITEISEKASLLVREEIELAKAEVAQKAARLGKGAAVAAAAGVFALFGLMFLLQFAAWILAELVYEEVWPGFLTVSVFFFLLAIIAGLIGVRWIKKGSPPTPDMAIEEAKRIQETVKG